MFEKVTLNEKKRQGHVGDDVRDSKLGMCGEVKAASRERAGVWAGVGRECRSGNVVSRKRVPDLAGGEEGSDF